MNRTSFLFLALLIGSCVLTVNSRHQARTLISEKASLQEKMNGQSETIRRLELEKSRLAAKLAEPLQSAAPPSGPSAAPTPSAAPAAPAKAPAMPPAAAIRTKASSAASPVKHH
jgi:cell division protein FtsL